MFGIDPDRVVRVAKRVMAAQKEDNIPIKAAGIAFFGLLSIIPALLATVSIYGLVSNPDDIRDQLGSALEGAPVEVRDFLVQQMADAADSSGGLGFALVVSTLLALWGASGGIKHLMATLNHVYGFTETRGGLMVRGLSILFTVGAILVLVSAVFLLAVLPGLLGAVGLGFVGRLLLGILRFPVMILLMAVALSILYFLAPNRPRDHPFRVVTVGAVIATLLWILLSGLLSIYTANFSGSNAALAVFGVFLVLQLWLLVTSFAVIIGAEVDKVREQMAVEDAEAAARAAELAARPRPRPENKTLAGALLGVAVGVAMNRARPKD